MYVTWKHAARMQRKMYQHARQNQVRDAMFSSCTVIKSTFSRKYQERRNSRMRSSVGGVPCRTVRLLCSSEFSSKRCDTKYFRTRSNLRTSLSNIVAWRFSEKPDCFAPESSRPRWSGFGEVASICLSSLAQLSFFSSDAWTSQRIRKTTYTRTVTQR